jgi:hypothetical protein
MNIKKMKLELEKMKVACAKQEMELRIVERMEEIARLEDNIKIQNARMEEISAELLKE